MEKGGLEKKKVKVTLTAIAWQNKNNGENNKKKPKLAGAKYLKH